MTYHHHSTSAALYNELRGPAVHEGGHAWAAQHLGARLLSAYVGFGRSGGVTFEPNGISRDALRVVGLAGCGAELLLSEPDATPERLLEVVRWHPILGLSKEDRSLTGDPDLGLARDALKIIRLNQGGIREYASGLAARALGQPPAPQLTADGRRKGVVYL